MSLAPTKRPGAENSSNWRLLEGREAVRDEAGDEGSVPSTAIYRRKKNTFTSQPSLCKNGVSPCDPSITYKWAEDLPEEGSHIDAIWPRHRILCFRDAAVKEAWRLQMEKRNIQFSRQAKGVNPEEKKNHCFLPQRTLPLFIPETCGLPRCGHIDDAV